jgi:hypothetical protein
VALVKKHEITINFIIENLISHIFLIHVSDGADLFPHLLHSLITKKLSKSLTLLLTKLDQLTAYTPSLTDVDLKSLYDSTGFINEGVLSKYSINLLNELLHNFCKI